MEEKMVQMEERFDEMQGELNLINNLLILLTLELGWENKNIKAYLKVNDEHLDFLRVL